MELSEIYAKLQTLGLPVAYMKFNTPQTLPFVVYREADTDIQGADDYNLYRDVTIVIELYSDRKRLDLERQIEELFRSVPLRKEADTYIKDEDMFMTAYSFDTIQKI